MVVRNLFVLVALLLVPVTLEAASVCNGLVAWYSLDGNAQDSSGSDNHGDVTGAIPAVDRFGADTAAYYFGNNPAHGAEAQDYILVPDSPSLRPAGGLSLSAWVNTSNSAGRSIVGKQLGTGQADSYILWYNVGTFWFTLSDFTTAAINAPIPSLGDWHHLAGTWDGSVVRLYVDGTEVANRAYSGINQYDESPLVIGADNDDEDEIPDDGWDGTIDEVRVYGRALSQTEIQDLADALFSDGFESGCVFR
jgi:hypothetical protein